MSNPEADDLRLRGNHEFAQGRYDAALSLYTAALEQLKIGNNNNTAVILLCNRSATYFQSDAYELAEEDALQAWTMSQQTSIKAAFRLAKARTKLGKYQLAKEVLQTALDRLEGDDDANAEKKALKDLWNSVLEESLKHTNSELKPPERTIKYAGRTVSIREFKKGKQLGVGNFSEILIVKHTGTQERFALKIITKKQAADLAKRQHPNVYNEIQMERRVLLERLDPHPRIIRMWHAFQDYTALYYLMDLHVAWSDLWNEVQWLAPETDGDGNTKYVKHMVGCHRNQAVRWMFQMVDALEHIHRHGIVHRDIKTENVMLNGRGQVVLLDFGTAKDLIRTDLNGPEFVGTPDFMSPEAVNGTSGLEEAKAAVERGETGATHAADLWAFGAMIFLVQTGRTPFWSPSPYLTFLRIKRGNLKRSGGIVDDEAWDLITKLMNPDPEKRIGASAFSVEHDESTGGNKIVPNGSEGYDVIRNHPYFASCREIESQVRDETPIPSLRDLCVRPLATLAYNDTVDFDVTERHPPGDDSIHDMTRLGDRDRAAVLHVLERRKFMRDEPQLYSRFFTDTVASQLDRVRPETCDYLGLTQMNDDGAKSPHAIMHDPHSKPPDDIPDMKFAVISNPLFSEEMNSKCDEVTRKLWMKLLKRAVSTVNRIRPLLVVVLGYVDEKCRKVLTRVSDSIPVILVENKHFFTFWKMGVQCIALKTSSLEEDGDQVAWLREQLEQCRLSKHPLFCFVPGDPRELHPRVVKRLARGRTLCMIGTSDNESFSSDVKYTANEKVANEMGDETASINSASSDENENDEFEMTIKAIEGFGLAWIHVDPEPDSWTCTFQDISDGA